MRKPLVGLFALVLVAGSQILAQTRQLPTDQPVTLVTPIFHQLLDFSLPPTFQLTAPDHGNQTQYLHEIPLRGETVEHWTQLVTVTGFNNLALNPNATPERVADKMMGGFKASCPQTFSMNVLPSREGGYTVLAGCGNVADAGGNPGATHSEVALIIVLRGTSDLYTLQWAERTPAIQGPAVLDEAKWMRRLRLMEPIRTCARIPGEKAPYPSCTAK